ncbi:PTS sugar transporter subunit IIA [Roseateles sp. BYS180W]|uniref:PTS sugar transporter subunit IIA n=1 Tax=Roseateles rivi TaxID=3299028 RepID=A0ABW7FUP8_9BURK
MSGLLLLCHAPMATALKSVAQHTYPECTLDLMALDVLPQQDVHEVAAAAAALMASVPQDEWLVLCDVFGATPCNAALQLATQTHPRVRVLSGVNVPMLWRTLCYRGLSLDELWTRASEGGHRGIDAAQAASPSLP